MDKYVILIVVGMRFLGVLKRQPVQAVSLDNDAKQARENVKGFIPPIYWCVILDVVGVRFLDVQDRKPVRILS